MDTQSKIFQNLNDALEALEIVSANDLSLVYNKLTKNFPAVIQANEETKVRD